jgi:hypothetical protein
MSVSWLVSWSVGHLLLLGNFGPYGIILITAAIVMLFSEAYYVHDYMY